MFTNNTVNNIHKSRYVSSWINVGGTLDRRGRGLFRKWLKTLVIDGRPLTDDEIMEIITYASDGKLELETNAKLFLKEEAKQ